MHATSKRFDIDKCLAYEMYKPVKSNRGAAGVDEQTIEQFEADEAPHPTPVRIEKADDSGRAKKQRSTNRNATRQ